MNDKDKKIKQLVNNIPKIRALLEGAEKAAQDMDGLRRAVKEKEDMFLAVTQSANDAIINIDGNGMVTFWNRGAEKMFGYSAEEMLGSALESVIPPRFRDAHTSGINRVAKGGNVHIIGKTVEFEALRKNGEELPVELTLSSWKSGKEPFFSGIVRDISGRKKYEERLNQLSFSDILTGLTNRTLFFDRLSQVLKQAQREKRLFALFFIDVDEFKEINETWGLDAGDFVLIETAKRLGSCVRQSDTVARLGGDEFAILLPQMANVQDAAIVAQKVMTEFSTPFHFKKNSLHVGVNIGISLYPYDGKNVETLVKNADIAMNQAKKEKESNIKFFSKNQ